MITLYRPTWRQNLHIAELVADDNWTLEKPLCGTSSRASRRAPAEVEGATTLTVAVLTVESMMAGCKTCLTRAKWRMK